MSRRIITLSAIGVALSGYYIFFRDRDDIIILFAISLLLLVLSYTFQYQIDQLMIRGVAQRLDAPMADMLIRSAPHFARWPAETRKMAEDRMKRWVLKKDFINKNEQDAPEDVKYILAYYAILLTIHQESFLYDGLDRIVFYHHPFLSPGYPDDVHIAEVEKEDGTIIVSVPHLLKGHFEKGYYNIALHTMAEAYQTWYLHSSMAWEENSWNQLEAISHISRDRIEAYIGIPVEDPWPVAVHHQLMYAGTSIPEVEAQLPQSKMA